MSENVGEADGQVNHVFEEDHSDLDRIEVISSVSAGSRCTNRASLASYMDQAMECIELCRPAGIGAQQRLYDRIAAMDYIRATTPTNMVRRWSQQMSRFNKDRRSSMHTNKRNIFCLPSRELSEADGLWDSVCNEPAATTDAEVAQLAADIEQYNCLMEDTAMSKLNRLDTLRALPQPLAMKRQLKQKLSRDIEQQTRQETRFVWIEHLWQAFVGALLWLWRLVRVVYRAMELWYSTLKTIESHFGRNVVAYFKFLRWLLMLNIALSVFSFSFIVLPQILYNQLVEVTQVNNTNVKFNFIDLLTAEGPLKNSLLFYGAYSNETFTLVDDTRYYNLSYSYYMTMLTLYLTTFVGISISMAHSYRKSFIEATGGTRGMCGVKVLCSWDYSITTRNAANLKHLFIYTELKELISAIDKAKQEMPLLWRIWNLCSQLIAHLLVLALIVGHGFAIWVFLQNFGMNKAAEETSSWSALRVACIVNCSLVLLQSLLAWIASMEDNYSPRGTLHITLVRNFMLETVVLGVVVYHWLTTLQTDCWETFLGQEMYRYIVFDCLLALLLIPLVNVFRVFVLCRYWKKCQRPAFDISQQSAGLVYNQTLLWVGFFFAPPLALLMTFKMLLTFYVKRATLMYLCKSPRHVWHSAQSRTLYIVFIFLSLLGAIIALGYVMTQLPVSDNCGPFRDYDFMFQVLIDGVLKLRQNRTIWRLLMLLIRPAVVGGALIILAIIVYYTHEKSRARCLMVKMLKEMIHLEVQDKRFLLANITNFMKNREWLLEELRPDASATAAADRYAESSASWRLARRMSMHRGSRHSADSVPTVSTSDECILRNRHV